ncbi:MFS transporter [Curtobacterium sp. MCPF17_047]|uniref:MFS transporter n=1 Tax=Curtobacterium sp. MCPF17_047 TaxID=2175654 RepID=UPI000DA95CB2|nr:MFS transporter [Curtobacterium sp. MCPF17_047]PZF63492.1 MFS transporter [Curtobacterium sp. MCPF17_047]
MHLSSRRRWTLLAVVTASLLLISLDNSILYTALPTLTEEIGATANEGLWIINAYPLVMAGLLLGAGTLGDRVGHRRMFLIGMSIFGMASLVAAFSPNPEVLIAARAILAVGAASMMPATLALIRVAFTNDHERNVAIAVWGSVAVLGGALGPIVSGLLLEPFWWGSVFLINVPVAVIALVAALFLAPPNDPDLTKKWDLLSSVYAMITLVGAVVAIKEIAHRPPSALVIGGALVAAVIGAVLFTRRQARLPYPLLDFTIFRNPAFSSGLLGAGLGMFAFAGVQLVTTQRFQLLEGMTPFHAGLLVALIAVGTLTTSLAGGFMLHRVGLLPLIAGGLALSAVGVVVISVSFHSLNGWLFLGLIVLGAGSGATMSVASTAIVGNVPARRAGMASSIEEVSYEMGNLSAVAILGSIVTAIYSALVRLPSGIVNADQARESLSAAAEAARASDDGRSILIAAGSAYDTGYFVVMVIVASVLGVGAIVTGILLRRHGPGTNATIPDADH